MTDPASQPPLGPAVDPFPRPLPARATLRGRHAVLEPIHRRHGPDLFRAAQAPGGEAGWTWMGYGPFADEAAMTRFAAEMGSRHDPLMWAVRPVASGRAAGWVALLDQQPGNAAIELGSIWFSPALQRTRAATEALAIPMRLAMEDLGYRRLVWKCHALNAPSRRAAERLGFTYEGLLRAHMVVKGRERDTVIYSMLAAEWPKARDALAAWLDDANFAPDGTARAALADLRARL